MNQVDQHTKRTRCTERDQVIPWYGKHCPLRVCVLTHGLCESPYVGVRCASMGLRQKEDLIQPMKDDVKW